ncbi:MAG: ParB/RepB/Spo0J family partition protein, partial [Cyanobacteria bacterium REEB65]|nr:ParB/RepB/Spo0J family partition protein [Cyanobacteria bacterium REEB65]
MRRSTSQEAAAVWVAISELHPWGQNPRLNEPAVAKVAESIERFGFGAPILARRNGELIAGHTRLKAALKLGLDRVPVRYLDLDPADAQLLALADNKLGEIAGWDEGLLAQILREFDAEDAAIAGFGTDELADLLKKLEPPILDAGITDPDDVPEPPVDPLTRLGDLWILGRHRLLCADSTDPTAVARLMGGEKPHAAITSPPYTDQREYGLGKFDWLAL